MARFLAGLAGTALFVLGREAVGIDDDGAVFALPDIAPSDNACRTMSQCRCRITAPQRISAVIPEYCWDVVAFFGMASSAFAAAVPSGGT